MKRWNRKMERMLSLLLCASMTVTLTACGSSQETNAQSTNVGAVSVADITTENEEAALTQALGSQVSASHSSQAGKEETVYVMADAKGAVNKIIVSDWVKNGEGSSTLEDKSDLKDIENVKGYEEFTKGSDGSLTWQADGADIYYQGTTEKELPVDVKISYRLNGQEMSPEEIAGKSGRITIRFDYENKQTEQVQVGNKEEEVYVPFAMISGMVLPSDTFSNIEVTNAKLISEGNNNLIVGVAFPGLKDSLQLEELKEEIEDKEKREELEEMEIPDYIEVSADAEEFSLEMTMTMAMSDVLSDITLTDSIDLSDINDSMDELSDASRELIDGTTELKDGTAELKDGTTELLDGAAELKDGTSELRSGTGTLLDGTEELKSGTTELKNGTGDLKNGTGTLVSGTGELKSGVDELKSGSQELYTKSGELNAGVGQLDEGAAALTVGSKKLAEGTEQLATGSLVLDAGAAQISAGLTGVQAAVAAMLSGFEGDGTETNPGLVAGMQTLTEGMKGLDSLLSQYFAVYEKTMNDKIAMLQSMKAQADNQAAAANTKLSAAKEEQAAAEATLALACEPITKTVQVEVTAEGRSTETVTVSGNLPSVYAGEGVTTADVSVTSVSAEEIKNAVNNYQSAIENVAAYQAEADAAAAQSATISEILAELTKTYMGTGVFGDQAEATQAAYITYIKEASANLAQGAESVNAGVGSVYQGLQALNDAEKGVPALAAGAKQLKQGTEEAVAGTEELSTGAEQLDSGAGTLKSGLDTLKTGTGLLAEGTGTLKNGVGALSEGTDKLNSGAKELDDGATKLKDGAVKLDDGVTELNNGVRELNDGAVQLDDGVAELKDGVTELDGGATKLNDGAGELKDGMIRFDEEGISKLTELFGDNVQVVLDRIDAVKKVGSDYNTFTGLKEGTTGSVRFIYKTDSVKAE